MHAHRAHAQRHRRAAMLLVSCLPGGAVALIVMAAWEREPSLGLDPHCYRSRFIQTLNERREPILIISNEVDKIIAKQRLEWIDLGANSQLRIGNNFTQVSAQTRDDVCRCALGHRYDCPTNYDHIGDRLH